MDQGGGLAPAGSLPSTRGDRILTAVHMTTSIDGRCSSVSDAAGRPLLRPRAGLGDVQRPHGFSSSTSRNPSAPTKDHNFSGTRTRTPFTPTQPGRAPTDRPELLEMTAAFAVGGDIGDASASGEVDPRLTRSGRASRVRTTRETEDDLNEDIPTAELPRVPHTALGDRARRISSRGPSSRTAAPASGLGVAGSGEAPQSVPIRRGSAEYLETGEMLP